MREGQKQKEREKTRRRNATFRKLEEMAGMYPVEVMPKKGYPFTCCVYGVGGTPKQGVLLYGSVPLGKDEISGLNPYDAYPLDVMLRPLHEIVFLRYAGSEKKLSCLPFQPPRTAEK